MERIAIKTQADFDALPGSFDEFTHINIKSRETIIIRKTPKNSKVSAFDHSSVSAFDHSSVFAHGNSSVSAHGHSSVVAYGSSSVSAYGSNIVSAYGSSSVSAHGHSTVNAWGNSSVVAWGYASVEMFGHAHLSVYSADAIVNKLLDYSIATFMDCPVKIKEKSATAIARETPRGIDVSFEEWLRRGWVVADGVIKKLKSQKKIGEIEVFECWDFPQNTTSYVVKRGDAFSHGETVEKAIEDLRYKVKDRDTSRFNSWQNNPDEVISIDDAIAGYRAITGACAMGVKDFIESIEIPERLTPNVIIEITNGNYGHDKLRKFLNIKEQERENNK